MLPAAKLLMMIVASIPFGPAPEATLVYQDGARTVTCELVAGAEDEDRWHEEWTCWSFKTGCQTDDQCEDSVRPIGDFERGDDNGKSYKVIKPFRETLFK